MTDTGVKPDEAARAIARSPSLKAKVAEVADDLAARATKADPAALLAVLVEHAPVYGIRNLSEGEYAAMFGVYLRALEPLPLEAVREAFVIWSRDGNGFFPKPEQIFQRADPVARELWMASYRAGKAVRWVEDHPRPKTEEERARDRQAAIDAGVLDANGKVILNFKGDPNARRVGQGETRQEMAERLRRIADGREAMPDVAAPPAADSVEEAI